MQKHKDKTVNFNSIGSGWAFVRPRVTENENEWRLFK